MPGQKLSTFLVLWWWFVTTKRSAARLSLMLDERRQLLQRYSNILATFLLTLGCSLATDLVKLQRPRLRTPRAVWARQRSETWWTDVVWRSWSAVEWKKNFRLSRDTFRVLCNELRPHIIRSQTKFREAISVRKRVAVCLWRLAGNCEYRTISHLFGIGRSTACMITNQVCSAIVQHLLRRYVRLPSGNRLCAVIRKFQQQQGLPQIGGAIDGTHIPIRAPVDHPDEYYNRKCFHSILLQAVVDSFGDFTDLCVGWPGRVHDARVFSNSSLYRNAERAGTCFPTGRSIEINGVMVPVMLVGDPAYPLFPWLMKPFPETGNRDRSKFNFKLSSTRMVVERAFGLLKGRFRILNKRQDTSLENVCNIVTACCVLHNYCSAHGDQADDDWVIDEEGVDVDDADGCGNPHEFPAPCDRAEARATREALLRYVVVDTD